MIASHDIHTTSKAHNSRDAEKNCCRSGTGLR